MKLFSQLILSSSLIFGVCLTQQCLSRSATAEDTLPEQVTYVNQLTDVQPTDWAFQALQALVDRYDCIVGYPDQKFQGNVLRQAALRLRSITRYEFAVGLNACLARLNQLLESTTADVINREDLQTLQRLQKEFAAELSILRGRVDSLATRTDQFESQQFSTTTKFTGEVVFAVSGAFGDDKAVPAGETPGSRGKVGDNIIFSDRVRSLKVRYLMWSIPLTLYWEVMAEVLFLHLGFAALSIVKKQVGQALVSVITSTQPSIWHWFILLVKPTTRLRDLDYLMVPTLP
ncbi:MAG: iron uptake porin [Nostoc desertorum CM1-VF14]|jgi:hypothetical protein|nr:iron uptake porin [Nostoc desertorum CM1-VF14]